MDNTQTIKLILTADGSGMNAPVAASTRELEKLEGQAGSLTSRLDGIAKTGIAVFLGSTLVSSAMSASKALYEASAQGQRLRTMLDYATGGKSASEMLFISKVANQLGLDINSTAQAYSGFAAAAKGTALEGMKTRNVFESVAKASAVMGLSVDDTKGVLLSLQQMVSKGTVQSEELRGQLGERLPGAFRIAADAMGVTTAELGKMLEKGQVVAEDFLPKFAAQLNSQIGSAAENAADRLDAATARMGNAWEVLKRSLGDSGISAAMASGFSNLTDNFTAWSEAMELAKIRGSGFWGQMGSAITAGYSLDKQIKDITKSIEELKQKGADFGELELFDQQALREAEIKLREILALKREIEGAKVGGGRGDATLQLSAWNERYPNAPAAAATEEPKKVAKQISAYEQLAKRLGGDLAKAYADAEAAALGLGHAQEAFLAVTQSPEWAGFTRQQKMAVLDQYEQMAALEATTEAAKASAVAKREIAKLDMQAHQAVLDESASVADHVKRLQAETAAIGLSKTKLAELEVARTEEALANAEATLATKLATGAKAEEIEAVSMLVEELRKLRTAQKDNASKTAAQDAADEWKHAAESIQGSITDALMRAFESGKGFAMAFRDTIANAFKTMVLQPAINTLVGTFGSMLGMSGANASTIGSALGSAGAGSSMLGSVGAALGLGSMSGLGGIFSMGAQLTGFTGAGTGMALQGAGSMMANGSIMQGLSQGAGALAPWAMGAAAGVYGGRAISGQYGSNATVNIGTAIGAAIAGPIGAAIGGLAGGVLNRAFGMGNKNTTEQGLQGSFGGGSASGNSYANWHQDGGWFRSDKNGVNTAAFDAATQEALNAGAAAVLAQSQGWAKALKLPAEQLANVTSSFKIKLTTDAEANQQAIADAITAYQGSITGSISKLLQPFQKAGEDLTNTFSRLATLQTFSASLNELGGVFHQLANLSVSARENIIALAGGMDALSQQAMSFAQNYYTRDEIAGLKAKEIQGALAGAGITQDIGTKEQFRALVEGLDLSTPAGQQQLATLLGVQGDFSAVADYIGTSGGTLAGTANLAPATGPLASLFGDQANAQVNAINGVSSGIDLVRQSIEYLTDVVKSTWGGGKVALPTKPGYENWEVSLP